MIVASPLYSQIGVYNETPQSSSALDIQGSGNSQGLLIPRMTTVQKTSIINPAPSLFVYDTDKNCISQNIGSASAPQWTCLTLFNRQFFYMPSINIPTSILGAASVDLFKIYQDQFATPKYSAGAPTSIPRYASADNLYYYVTYYDPKLITINQITAAGVMNYTVLKKANYDSYMNIVFVVK